MEHLSGSRMGLFFWGGVRVSEGMRDACFLGSILLIHHYDMNLDYLWILQRGGKGPTSFLLDLCSFLPVTIYRQVIHKKISYLHVIKLIAITSYIKSTVVCKCSSVKFAFWLIYLSIHKL